jgi:ABC-2 type transport system permease protein
MTITIGGLLDLRLVAVRARALRNAATRTPARYLVGLVLLGAICAGTYLAVFHGVRFVDGLPAIGTIADAALQRSVEALVTLLMFGVAFSVLTTAVTTLYASDDLAFLLSLPLPPSTVFAQKVFETYLGSALLPALLTLPLLTGIGVAREAPWSYYPLAAAAVLALFALPVALGALVALVLMRVAPAARVREVATAASVVLAAGFVLALRALRPEQLAEMTPEQFEALLDGVAALGLSAYPPGWAGSAIWSALRGDAAVTLPALLGAATLSLGVLTALAANAYRAGWVRGVEGAGRRLDRRVLRQAPWELSLARLGPMGAVVAKDVRLLLRDPAQWSQVLVLVALAGVYLVSTVSLSVEGQRFRDVLGTLSMAFLGFVMAGVGARLAFPIVSLEGEGWWLVRTAPLSIRRVVLGKFLYALPPLLAFGLGLALAQALLLDVSRTLASASLVAGGLGALAITALGVGLGAAFPRFDAPNPSEIPVSPGGLLYMALSLLYAAGLAFLLAYPAWRTLVDPASAVWSTSGGRLVLLAAVALTVLVSVAALTFGILRLRSLESGRD